VVVQSGNPDAEAATWSALLGVATGADWRFALGRGAVRLEASDAEERTIAAIELAVTDLGRWAAAIGSAVSGATPGRATIEPISAAGARIVLVAP
jgi:hypothetical protein